MDFAYRFTWQDWVTIVSLVFGVVSLIAYLDQRRSAREMTILAKWAGLNLDKSMSEAQVRELLTQKAVMEEQITRKVPALARRAVLQEQSKLHEQAIAEHFATWQTIANELESKASLSVLEPQLQQALLDRIVPRYMRRERRDRLRTRVTVLSVVLAVFAASLPSPLGSIFGGIMALPLLYAAARLYALNEDAAYAYRYLRPWVHLGYMVIVLTIEAAGLVLRFYPGSASSGESLSRALIIVGVFLAVLYVIARKWIDRLLKHICSTPGLVSPTGLSS
jgi:hypothetical protein